MVLPEFVWFVTASVWLALPPSDTSAASAVSELLTALALLFSTDESAAGASVIGCSELSCTVAVSLGLLSVPPPDCSSA